MSRELVRLALSIIKAGPLLPVLSWMMNRFQTDVNHFSQFLSKAKESDIWIVPTSVNCSELDTVIRTVFPSGQVLPVVFPTVTTTVSAFNTRCNATIAAVLASHCVASDDRLIYIFSSSITVVCPSSSEEIPLDYCYHSALRKVKIRTPVTFALTCSVLDVITGQLESFQCVLPASTSSLSGLKLEKVALLFLDTLSKPANKERVMYELQKIGASIGIVPGPSTQP